jgi:hypothetical protein
LIRWYALPLKEGGRTDYSYFFEGPDAELLALAKVRELNEQEGGSTLNPSGWEYLRFKASP